MSNTNPTGGWQANVKRHTVRLAVWTLTWVVSMAVTAFGPPFFWNENRAITTTAIVVNLLIGFGMIVAIKNHVRSLDEMQQKIQLDAMGLTLGVALVAGLAYSNLDTTNIISSDAEISHLVILMGLTYMGGIAFGTRRYS